MFHRPARARPKALPGGPSLTQQSHKSQCDIHNIMRKYERTGIIEHVRRYEGQYMNLASMPEFMDAQLIIAQAKTMFESVPAKIRSQFDNDPGHFLAFMQNPKNRDEILELGLSASHLAAPEAIASPATPPPAPTPPSEGSN